MNRCLTLAELSASDFHCELSEGGNIKFLIYVKVGGSAGIVLLQNNKPNLVNKKMSWVYSSDV